MCYNGDPNLQAIVQTVISGKHKDRSCNFQHVKSSCSNCDKNGILSMTVQTSWLIATQLHETEQILKALLTLGFKTHLGQSQVDTSPITPVSIPRLRGVQLNTWVESLLLNVSLPLTSQLGTHQDALAFTLQQVCDQVRPRPPQQLVWANASWMHHDGCLHLSLILATCEPIAQDALYVQKKLYI